MSMPLAKIPDSDKWARSRRNVLAAGTLLATQLLVGCKDDKNRLLPRSDLKDGPNCYVKGTGILTHRGERKIEDLHVGEVLISAQGPATAKWIGRRQCHRSGNTAWAQEIRPVRIRRGALDPGVPHDDLVVSPGHRILFSNVLVRAADMVDGSSIFFDDCEDLTTLEYFHVLTHRHDIIFANGAPGESLFPKRDAMVMFDNAQDYFDTYGTMDDFPSEPCAPVMTDTGGRARLFSHVRRALSPLIDCRDQFDIARDELMDRAARQVNTRGSAAGRQLPAYPVPGIIDLLIKR